MFESRFPPPWIVEDHDDACFIVKDVNGFAVAYVYYEEEPGRRTAANLMTRDEARRIAVNIAKLPDLLISKLSFVDVLRTPKIPSVRPFRIAVISAILGARSPPIAWRQRRPVCPATNTRSARP